MKNFRDRYGHEYIFLIRKKKLNDLDNVRMYSCLSVYTVYKVKTMFNLKNRNIYF